MSEFFSRVSGLIALSIFMLAVYIHFTIGDVIAAGLRWSVYIAMVIIAIAGTLALVKFVAVQAHDFMIHRELAKIEVAKAVAELQQMEQKANIQFLSAPETDRAWLVTNNNYRQHNTIINLSDNPCHEINGRAPIPTPLEVAILQNRFAVRHPHPALATHAQTLLPQTDVELPHRIDLQMLLEDEPISMQRVIIGQAVNDAGSVETVTASLTEMVHVGMVASSGFGKSVGMQSLALQLALANESIEICFIDAVEGVTSAPFQDCNRLRYPVAHNAADGQAILLDLREEMKRRMALFEPHRVQKLTQYNTIADRPLPYIAVFFEEVTMMMEAYPELHNLVAEMVTQLRKTGIFFFLAGQEMTAKSMRPIIRRQLSSRFAFHVNDHWQAQGLGMGREAVELNVKGRAWAVLPGRRKMLLQTPYIEATAIEAILAKRGRLGAVQCTVPATDIDTQGIEKQALDFAHLVVEDGHSRNKAAQKVWGRSYAGNLVAIGQSAIEKFSTTATVPGYSAENGIGVEVVEAKTNHKG